MLLALTLLAGSAHQKSGLQIEELSTRAPAGEVSSEATKSVQEISRRELLETFDKIVTYEGYYRSVYGRYTRLLSRVGYSIPEAVQETYEIRVSESSSDRLLVTALSEVDGRIVDLASVDQDFRIHANFPLPAPRPEYLRGIARKYVRLLKESISPRRPGEPTVFHGYFAYRIRYGSEGEREFVAQGKRAPVRGVEIALGDGAQDPDHDWGLFASLERETREMSKKPEISASLTGEWARGQMSATLEQAYLAQRIFHGETGRYARSWDELARIAAFPFEGKDQYGSDVAPFGDVPSASFARETPPLKREPAAKLDIEPIPGAER